MRTVELAIMLLSIAAVVAVVTRFLKAPYTLSLVVVGLACAMTGYAPTSARITQDLVLILFLPPLLSQAGLHLRLELLRKVWAPVLVMAIPGVIVTALTVAAAVKPSMTTALGPELATWQLALLFGVVLAPTDPISVMATFNAAGAPRKLKTMVEGESLFNDGTALAVFALLKAAIFAGILMDGAADADAAHSITVLSVVGQFVMVAGLGIVLGLAFGMVAWLLIHHLDDHTLETAITIALAWGVYLVAESVHASGVIATIVAALLIGNDRMLHMSKRTRTTLAGFWDSIDFVINSILFLLIGFELADPAIGGVRRLIEPEVLLTAGIATAALLTSRAIVAYPVMRALKSHWPPGWKHIVFWSGLKGSLTLALILGLPDGAVREFFAPVAFLVVLFSLLGQGLTMPILMRALNVGSDDPSSDE